MVLVPGENGTIDGQGEMWWQKFHHKQLKHTRPYLIELMYSDSIQISHLTLINSPSWNVHPIYSRFDSSITRSYLQSFFLSTGLI